MSTLQALAKYNEIAQRVFGPSDTTRSHQEGIFNATTLEQEIRKLVAENTESKDEDERMLDVKDVHKKGLVYVSFIQVTVPLRTDTSWADLYVGRQP